MGRLVWSRIRFYLALVLEDYLLGCYMCLDLLLLFFPVWQRLDILSLSGTSALRKHFAAPLTRRRLFIILIRRDVMAADVASEDFTTTVKKKLTDLLGEFATMDKPEWHLALKSTSSHMEPIRCLQSGSTQLVWYFCFIFMIPCQPGPTQRAQDRVDVASLPPSCGSRQRSSLRISEEDSQQVSWIETYREVGGGSTLWNLLVQVDLVQDWSQNLCAVEFIFLFFL